MGEPSEPSEARSRAWRNGVGSLGLTDSRCGCDDDDDDDDVGNLPPSLSDSQRSHTHPLTCPPTVLDHQGKLSRSESKEYVTPMYPPGELVFLRKLREEAWDAVWIKAEDLMDEGLLVDWGMARDHLLGTTLSALETACGRRPGTPSGSRPRT